MFYINSFVSVVLQLSLCKFPVFSYKQLYTTFIWRGGGEGIGFYLVFMFSFKRSCGFLSDSAERHFLKLFSNYFVWKGYPSVNTLHPPENFGISNLCNVKM